MYKTELLQRKTTRFVLVLPLLLAMMIIVSGCAFFSSPVGQGFIATNVRGPVAVTESEKGSKVGFASCVNVLGMIAAGNASIDAAMENGGITKVHHVDKRVFSILFFFVKYTTIVHGE